MRVLIVEDSQQVMETVVDYLELEGVECDCAYDGRQALALLAAMPFDVVIADIAMPHLDGIATVREMRTGLRLDTPVLFLTARDALEDKMAAFEAGGDDYLLKPFAMVELWLRVQALARRRQRTGTDLRVLRLGELELDSAAGEVRWAGEPVRLGRLQRRILEQLMANSPARVTREALVQALWGSEAPASDALRSHVYALRTALDRAGATPVLETVHGEGYRLLA